MARLTHFEDTPFQRVQHTLWSFVHLYCRFVDNNGGIVRGRICLVGVILVRAGMGTLAEGLGELLHSEDLSSHPRLLESTNRRPAMLW